MNILNGGISNQWSTQKEQIVVQKISLWSRIFYGDSNQDKITKQTERKDTLHMALPRCDHLVKEKQAQGSPNWFSIMEHWIYIKLKYDVSLLMHLVSLYKTKLFFWLNQSF